MKRIFPVKVLTAVMLAVMTLCACDNGVPPELPLVPPDPPPWTYTYTLPETETVLTRIDEIYGSREKAYLLGDTVQRMPCPTAGNVMTFHMGYEVGAYARIVLEDAVDELNEVFAVVNPNYRFRINYAPTPSDYDSRYSIRMTLTDHFSSPTVMGTAQMSTGAELSNFGITLKDTTLDDLRYLMLTFRHEYMHLLGAGDAYENPLADKTTVMQNYNNTTYRHLSSSDVAFIDAYYRNPHNPLSDAEIKTFIADYETDNRHTQSELLSQVLHAAMHRDDTSVLLSELDAKHYADTAALRAELARGVALDRCFGDDRYYNFTELAYLPEYKPNDTYYGAFDTLDEKYTHGTKRGTMSFSQTISYTDFDNGMLLAMPGGTDHMTLFIRLASSEADKYILTFHADGLKLGNDWQYYVTFADLRLSLLQACTLDK
ncbi:MAG: hypothetical protein HFK10_06465 [Clostridia bacterium]|jgi:hypothetical protein|nr:hypothetical protein [Clostridia bacterium]